MDACGVAVKDEIRMQTVQKWKAKRIQQLLTSKLQMSQIFLMLRTRLLAVIHKGTVLSIKYQCSFGFGIAMSLFSFIYLCNNDFGKKQTEINY